MHNVGLLEAQELDFVKNSKFLIFVVICCYSMSEQTRPFWIFMGREKNDGELHLRKKQ